ncbi:holo-[acyl-carrier-protein] synthase ASCRUDRAFT_75971 [Ascoidea rubescens DSM 1968]|uniref:holo-[acyl-carrier-protein] synthase n=1 Tax=Ascoidea rubescens DSM 1968 TaxID=1344418 RepID=A0A1D2VHZ7_9ASCO|nr:hypothetical protein ASCRUDRAFT_75971 [Ascoidea rubescens DSM 1968]ODV61281.1 hypothetical protein ASCRUDRAFT_75971 [Ascoidea rubescens DSM 1968]
MADADAAQTACRHVEALACGSKLLFVVDLSSRASQAFVGDAFSFEMALSLLPLAQQLSVRNKRLFRAQTNALANQMLRLFVVLLLLLQQHRRPSLSSLLAGFSSNAHGKPIYPSLPYCFNLSNSCNASSNLCSMVVANTPANQIGVDLAHSHDISSTNDLLAEFESIFHPHEYSHIQKYLAQTGSAAINNSVLLAQFWALKESLSKLIGTGLVNIDLSSYHFSFDIDHFNQLAPSQLNTDHWFTEITLFAQAKKLDYSIYLKQIQKDLYCSVIHENSSSSVSANSSDNIKIINVGLEEMFSVLSHYK